MVIGGTQQLTATGTFTDASTQNISSSATWTSSNTGERDGKCHRLGQRHRQRNSHNHREEWIDLRHRRVTVTPNPALPTGIGWHALPIATSLESSGACPPNGFGGDPYQFADNCQNVIRTWNGAIADTTANRLIIWGGGHDNYFGNEIYSLNLIANPITLTRVKDPTVPTNFANDANCIDGIPPGSPNFAPNAREGYGGLVFLPTPNRLMILDGSLACIQGDGSSNTWTIPLSNISSSTSWVHEDPTLSGTKPNADGDGPYGNVAAYDPNSGLVFVSDSEALYTYKYSTNTYTQITAPKGFITGIYLSGAIDPTRKLFVLVGGCSGRHLRRRRWSFRSGYQQSGIDDAAKLDHRNAGRSQLRGISKRRRKSNQFRKSRNHLRQRSQRFRSLAEPGQQRIYNDARYHQSTPDLPETTFTGGPPNSADANNQPNTSYGTFGRFRYFPAIDAFVLVNDWNIPAYILRLR